jgi:Domain of unknown function (DUF4440)
MHLKMLPAILFLANLSTGFAQTTPGDNKPKSTDTVANSMDSVTNAAELLNLEQRLLDGMATGDTGLWKAHLSPGYMIVNEDGSRSDYSSFINGLRPLPKGSSGHILIKNPHFDFTGNEAIFNYVADEYETAYGQALHTTYATMSVYQKQPSGWRLLNTQTFEIPQLPTPIPVTESILQQYAGAYYLTPDISGAITLEDHRLYWQRMGRKKEELLPETASVFFRRSDTRGRKIFLKDPEGKWQMRDRRNGQDLVWLRK